MKQLNIHPHLRRFMAATLAIIMAMSLAVPVFAAEPEDTGPDLEAIAALFVDWDGSYELPDLSELSEEDQEAVKAMVDAAMLAKEAEAQAEAKAQTETQAETQTPAEINDEVPTTVSFSDVPTSHTFYKGVVYCASKGIVNGYPDGTFRPATTVAKNHFCAMLARAFYADQLTKYDTDYYKKTFGTFGPTNMTLATNGTLDKTSFRWQYTTSSIMSSGINRYDMAQLMTNIMKAKGATATTAQKNAAQSKIADYKNIPSEYQDAVKNVYALGIIGGYANGTFGGNNIMNRGQAAIVIQRMAQYAPVKGDQDNDVYDDGTEQKPSTGSTGSTSSGNTGSSSSGNTGTSSGSTGSSTSTTTKPETKPETPAARTLSNGKAITENNVMAILDQLKAKYPRKTDFAKGYAGLSSGRSAAKNCIAKVVDTYRDADGYRCSTSIGCGGWAAFVADEIFGQTGVTWKKTNIANARPGDLMIKLDANGRLTHVEIYVSESTDGLPKTQEVYVTDAATSSNGVYRINWVNDTGPSTRTIDVWTAYPN